MTRTASTMLPLGTPALAFSLPDVSTGQTTSLDTFAGVPALLVMFICRHCPYVKHVQGELARLGRDYGARGVALVGISANDAGAHPEDSPASLKAMVAEQGFAFPVCHDESQDTAKAYAAACTPDFFLFDAARRLVYRGQLDASRPGGATPTGADLRAAMDAVLDGRSVESEQTPSLGCNIKWKPGNEPAYFSG
jgi:peroxiredoxin